MTRCKDDDFKRRQIPINSVTNVPGSTNRAIIAGAERKIWDTSNHTDWIDTKYEVSSV